ncbi:hypothetical protein SV7mr_11000 [Stieleria bergensis]|uniref:Uncharacterized protein n=1 Tax=Stieleria bergensis TaxID=2528025 RepID=A0A517SR59_9BACT|nr:MAG: hypothetical protein CBB71_03580 [Rhodopirellula sp. TMED11]QDT58607.1 hypothetical protein SV7mr_11000 [Planctomycetes bacterium SV_7m_r]
MKALSRLLATLAAAAMLVVSTGCPSDTKAPAPAGETENTTTEGTTETPAEETPAEETPAEETPAEETPAAE